MKKLTFQPFFQLFNYNFNDFLKVDDDAYFNPLLLHRLIKSSPPHDGGGGMMAGRPSLRAAPRRDVSLLDTSYFGKFLVPRHLYPGDSYPPYLVGFYLLDRAAAECLWRVSEAGTTG